MRLQALSTIRSYFIILKLAYIDFRGRMGPRYRKAVAMFPISSCQRWSWASVCGGFLGQGPRDPRDVSGFWGY